VLYHYLVKPGYLSLERLVEALTSAPVKILNLPESALKTGNPADLTIIDLGAETIFTPESILSKSKNTPWLNQTVSSKVLYTFLEGRQTWKAE